MKRASKSGHERLGASGPQKAQDVVTGHEVAAVLRALGPLAQAMGASTAILAALSGLADQIDVPEALSRAATGARLRARRAPRPTGPQPTVGALVRASREDAARLLADPRTPVSVLAQLAHERFGLSRGTAGRLSREELVARIGDGMRDEAGHAAIAHLVQQHPNRGASNAARATVPDPALVAKVVEALRPLSDSGLSVYALSRGWGDVVRAVRERVPDEVFDRLATGARNLDGADWAAAHDAVRALEVVLAGSSLGVER